MSVTLQQTIDYCQPFINYMPLTAGENSEPAISIANGIQAFILGAPFVWPWNRALFEFDISKDDGQDYYQQITNFGFLERASLQDDSGRIYEIKDVFNGRSLSQSVGTQRPFAISVMSVDYDTEVSGGNVFFRFSNVPDQDYSCLIEYQQAPSFFTETSQDWSIPQNFQDVFQTLFLAEAYETVSDAMKAQQYRQRGVAALLARSSGLSEVDKSWILQQWLSRGIQESVAGLRAQQAQQARGI